MNDIKISVIMSTYNTPIDYLNKSINSILNQSFKDFEFIIVCDGSVEEYQYIKAHYEDKRIKLLLHDTNLGLPNSLNDAIAMSTGKYIARMDSDDISCRKRLEKQYNYMEKHKNIELLGTDVVNFGKENKVDVQFLRKPQEIQIKMLYTTCFYHPSVMIKADVLKKLKYDEKYKYSQDFELFSRLTECNNATIIHYIGLYYRKHYNQISESKKNQQTNFMMHVLENNSKKLFPISPSEANSILQVLSGAKKINISEYKNLVDSIEVICKECKQFDEKALRKVLYNRLLNLIRINDLKFFDVLKFDRKILNFNNLKYYVLRIYVKSILDKFMGCRIKNKI